MSQNRLKSHSLNPRGVHTGSGLQLSALLRHRPTGEATKPQRPEPPSAQSVIQHGQGVAGVVQLAASYDPKVVQRQQAHGHMSHEHVALDLHDPLRKRWTKNKKGRVKTECKNELFSLHLNTSTRVRRYL